MEGKSLSEGGGLSRKRIEEVLAETNIKKYGLSQIRSRINSEKLKKFERRLIFLRLKFLEVD